MATSRERETPKRSGNDKDAETVADRLRDAGRAVRDKVDNFGADVADAVDPKHEHERPIKR